MARHNELGRLGEQIAAEYLVAKGYTIRERNWRCNKLEIDIVAEKNNRIIVVEVKTRSSTEYGQPIEAITREKIMYLVRAARAYINAYRLPHEIQFDIITLIGHNATDMRLEHIEDAFPVPLRTYR